MLELKWAPLNGITDNGINRIIESLFGTFSKSHELETGLFIGKRNIVNGIVHLLGSDVVRPKVIPLSGTYCISEA
jgi:hypothetical protein